MRFWESACQDESYKPNRECKLEGNHDNLSTNVHRDILIVFNYLHNETISIINCAFEISVNWCIFKENC